jgi:phosphoribosylanthranilate isomerase
MRPIRVKICGITRPEDALQAARCGADAIGLVFYSSSPRAVSVHQTKAIIEVLPPFVSTVGLFVNAGQHEVEKVLSQVPLDLLQFHGEESAQDCELYGRPYIKAISMKEGVDISEQVREYKNAKGLLLDTYHKELPGGTGMQFDWSRVPQDLEKPVILAGGLNADNVAEAIRQTEPFAVDVSGGVESEKGIKDPDKIAAFIREVRRVESI